MSKYFTSIYVYFVYFNNNDTVIVAVGIKYDRKDSQRYHWSILFNFTAEQVQQVKVR